MQFPTFKNEAKCLADGFDFVAGCDEVGIGPVAGPVAAAACIIDPNSIHGYRSKSKWFYRVRDSKTVGEGERQALAKEIKSHCIVYGIGEVWPDIIDRINIHQAALLAMKRAAFNMLAMLGSSKDNALRAKRIVLLIDGRFTIAGLAGAGIQQKAIIDGDAKVLSISAASIIAKTYRDQILRKIDWRFPQYGFVRHKGYNTKEHRQAILAHGITAFHRKSFLKNMEEWPSG